MFSVQSGKNDFKKESLARSAETVTVKDGRAIKDASRARSARTVSVKAEEEASLARVAYSVSLKTDVAEKEKKRCFSKG